MNPPHSPARRRTLAAGLALASASGAAAVAAASGSAAAATRDDATTGSRALRSERPSTMSAWRVGAQQGIDSLERVTVPRPEPRAHEVLVRVRAAALNHRDLLVAAGRYNGRKPPERIPVGDGAGEIVALGAGVEGLAVGEQVTAPHFCSWLDGEFFPQIFQQDLGSTRDGWLAEYILLPAAAVVKLPPGWSPAEAAAVGAAGLTAWSALVAFGRIRAGDLVLTLGTGGVSMAVLQLARLHGARCAITSSSDAKLEAVRALGAQFTINRNTHPEWDRELLAQTGGRGADIVAETVGHATLARSIGCCAPNARIAMIGTLGGRPAPDAPWPAVGRGNSMVKGITSGPARMLADVLRALDAGALRPRIDRRFGWDEARAAFAWLDAGEFMGKIVIDVG